MMMEIIWMNDSLNERAPYRIENADISSKPFEAFEVFMQNSWSLGGEGPLTNSNTQRKKNFFERARFRISSPEIRIRKYHCIS